MGLIMKKKKKKKTLKEDGTDSEGDNLDLTVEVHPLSHYVTEQEELVNQMFATIRGSKLDGMLPPKLKSIPLPELKKLCLHELRGMSKKRILCVINGQEMEGSSDSEEEEEDVASVEENQTKSTPDTKHTSNAERNGESSSNDQAFPEYLMKTIKIEPADDVSPGDKNAPGKKSVLELLELQMRARIIKTMLEKSEDGKTLTEGAIAALIGTTTTASQISEMAAVHPEISKALSRSDDKQENDDKEGKENEENSKERRGRTKRNSDGEKHRDDDGRHSRSSHKKSRHRKSTDRRRTSKRQRTPDVKDDEDTEKKSKRDRSFDERSKTKKKITRREFEERMKRAKKNRTYRQRRSSEDEEKANASKEKEGSKDEGVANQDKAKKGHEENGMKKSDIGETVSGKEEGEVASGKEEGEAESEKEEGECDSDEEEEGACSPSDISSASYYSSSRSYSSRSRSRSYSRSWSRSPVRRRGRGRGRSRTRSRSRSNDKKRRDSSRWSRKRTRDRGSSGNKKMSGGIVSLPGVNQKQQKEEEENWGQKCDIEFVDSEEDFDDNTTDTVKISTVDGTKKPLPAKGQNSERASISFSLQKKLVPSITLNVDLDDLPLKSNSSSMGKERNSDMFMETKRKKEEMPKPDEIIDLDSPKVAVSEILISSDSENEAQPTGKAVSVRVEKREFVHSVNEVPDPLGKNKLTSGVVTEAVATVDKTDDNSVHSASQRTATKDSEPGDNVSSNKEDSFDKQGTSEESKGQVSEMQQNLIDKIQTESLSKYEEITAQKKDENSNNDEFVDVEDLGRKDCNVQGNEITGEIVTKDDDDDLNKPDIDSQTSLEMKRTINELECLKTIANEEKELVVNETPRNNESESVETSISEQAEKSLNNSLESIHSTEKEKENLSELVHCNTSNRKYEANIEKVPEETLRKVNESKVSKQRKSARKQKVELEHLQESFDEEQNLMQEPCNTEQAVPSSSKISLCDIAANPAHEMSQVEPLAKLSSEMEEDCQETHNVGGNENNSILRLEKEEENVLPKPDEEQTVNPDEVQVECTNDDDRVNKEELVEDFYRGADQLAFSDEEAQNSMKDTEDIIQDDREVEPIRIDTGLIRRRVTRSRKVEMAAPDKSWTKKEKRKKEKPKDVLAMEGIGLLRTQLAESAQSPLSKEDDEDQLRLQDSSEGKETSEQGNDDDTCASWGVSSISSKDDASLDFKIQSPKDSSLEDKEACLKGESDEKNEVEEEGALQKRGGQETEIIGVIETSHDPDADHMDGIDLGGSSWSMRWLQSEKVQKVVSSSKMLSRVRKKIQKKEKATKVIPTPRPEVPQEKLPEPVVPIIGSIEEYERLFGIKAKQASEAAAAASSVASPSATATTALESEQSTANQECAKPQKKKTSFGSDDEGEDSEEEALWSKILGK